MDINSYNQFSVTQLQALLKSRGIPYKCNSRRSRKKEAIRNLLEDAQHHFQYYCQPIRPHLQDLLQMPTHLIQCSRYSDMTRTAGAKILIRTTKWLSTHHWASQKPATIVGPISIVGSASTALPLSAAEPGFTQYKAVVKALNSISQLAAPSQVSILIAEFDGLRVDIESWKRFQLQYHHLNIILLVSETERRLPADRASSFLPTGLIRRINAYRWKTLVNPDQYDQGPDDITYATARDQWARSFQTRRYHRDAIAAERHQRVNMRHDLDEDTEEEEGEEEEEDGDEDEDEDEDEEEDDE